MLGLISRKTYLIIGLGFAFFLFLVGTFFGKDIAAFAASLPGQMPSPTVASLAQFIVQPLRLVMENLLVGSIIAGLLWPLIFLEIFLLILILILVVFAQVRTSAPV